LSSPAQATDPGIAAGAIDRREFDGDSLGLDAAFAGMTEDRIDAASAQLSLRPGQPRQVPG
jgi:hypothetical protein